MTPLRELGLACLLQDLAWLWPPGRERTKRQRMAVDYFARSNPRDLAWLKHAYGEAISEVVVDRRKARR